MQIIGQIWDFLDTQAKAGVSPIVLRGGRRAGKTWCVCQFLITQIYNYGDTVVFATMTEGQGDAGVYEDCKNIIAGEPKLAQHFEIMRAPRQINCNVVRDGRTGKGRFKSFRDPETAKGGACDWVFINEANKFTLQQYYDLAANARKGVICDFNPNKHFWIEDLISPSQELLVKWQWNKRNLTAAQLQWFDDIYRRAHSDGATAADVYYCAVYYEGEYADMQGDVFTPDNLQFCTPDEVPALDMVIIFSDPSACCGADYHATVMAGMSRAEKRIYILDTDSRNIGTEYDRAMMLQAWCVKRDRVRCYIETNGAIGQQFYNYCHNSKLPVVPFNSRANKIERIMANYHTITSRVTFVQTDHLQDYMQQIYTFDGYVGKCEHDDNIDAVNSAVSILKPYIDYNL